jgi:hypothetical protein
VGCQGAESISSYCRLSACLVHDTISTNLLVHSGTASGTPHRRVTIGTLECHCCTSVLPCNLQSVCLLTFANCWPPEKQPHGHTCGQAIVHQLEGSCPNFALAYLQLLINHDG